METSQTKKLKDFFNIIAPHIVGHRTASDLFWEVIKELETTATHPSDSDIEKMWPGEVWDEGKNELVRVLELNRARQEGAKWMRDRMNGEMVEFGEWLARNYTRYAYGWIENSHIFGIRNPEKEDMRTTEQLLQKFRNRDL